MKSKLEYSSKPTPYFRAKYSVKGSLWEWGDKIWGYWRGFTYFWTFLTIELDFDTWEAWAEEFEMELLEFLSLFLG